MFGNSQIIIFQVAVNQAPNLFPKVLSFPSPGARERETQENTGHVSLRTWEMRKHNIEGGAGKFLQLLLTYQPLPLCYVLSSPRFWDTRDQRFPGSLCRWVQGTGRRGSWEQGCQVPMMLFKKNFRQNLGPETKSCYQNSCTVIISLL